MQLQIRPHPKNIYPIGGMLVRNPSPIHWIREIQRMQLSIKDIHIFPVPGNVADSIWGCFIIVGDQIDKINLGNNELCQAVSSSLFIPERATLFPSISISEIEQLFSTAKHIIHPEFGMVELTEELNIEELILSPQVQSYYVTRPATGVFIPRGVKSFQIAQVTPEDVIKNLEEKIFPKKERMKDEPLNLFEKGRLLLYKAIFTKGIGSRSHESSTEKRKGWAKIEKAINNLFNTHALSEELQQDFEELEKRNRKEVDKLMDMLRNNPQEALKYAIPLNESGSTRGSDNGSLNLSKYWFDLSWMSKANSGGVSGSVNLGDKYFELQNQYLTTAETLIAQKKYHDAAFIYMKLLKNPYKAAETLETGGHYQDAATIFLKHAHNKQRAAACYEKGNMVLDAIEVYKELNENEKVGDLYTGISRKKEADIHYQKVVDDYKLKNKYVKAAILCKEKMSDEHEAQQISLEGWRNSKDAANCLNYYFSNIKDVKKLKTELDSIYKNEVSANNYIPFLQAIKHEYSKKNELAGSIREMAYQIIADNIGANPSIVSELRTYNPDDKELLKDTIRFKLMNR